MRTPNLARYVKELDALNLVGLVERARRGDDLQAPDLFRLQGAAGTLISMVSAAAGGCPALDSLALDLADVDLPI